MTKSGERVPLESSSLGPRLRYNGEDTWRYDDYYYYDDDDEGDDADETDDADNDEDDYRESRQMPRRKNELILIQGSRKMKRNRTHG